MYNYNMIVNKKFTIAPFASPLQEELLCILAQGAIDGADLLAKVSLKIPTTKQGLYKTLRNLLQNEIAVKEGLYYLSLIHISEPHETDSYLVCRLLLEKK